MGLEEKEAQNRSAGPHLGLKPLWGRRLSTWCQDKGLSALRKMKPPLHKAQQISQKVEPRQRIKKIGQKSQIISYFIRKV